MSIPRNLVVTQERVGAGDEKFSTLSRRRFLKVARWANSAAHRRANAVDILRCRARADAHIARAVRDQDLAALGLERREVGLVDVLETAQGADARLIRTGAFRVERKLMCAPADSGCGPQFAPGGARRLCSGGAQARSRCRQGTIVA